MAKTWQETVIQQQYPVNHEEHLRQLQKQAEATWEAREAEIEELWDRMETYFAHHPTMSWDDWLSIRD